MTDNYGLLQSLLVKILYEGNLILVFLESYNEIMKGKKAYVMIVSGVA